MSQLKNAKTLTAAALLTAVAIVLGFLKIPVTDLIEIRFASLPIAIAGMLFGPAVAGTVGGLADIGGYLVKPTGPFFPGFTLSNVAEGILFGMLLHRKNLSVRRILLAQGLETALVGILLNSLWLSVLYGNPFRVVVAARIVKELVMYPLNAGILTAAVKPVRMAYPAGRLSR